MALRPNYQLFSLNLNAAGNEDIPGLFSYVRVISAVDQNGNQALSALVNLQLARNSGDPIPMRINGAVKVPGGTEFLRLSWAAQPGLTVIVFASMQDGGDGVQVEAPPSQQLVSSAVGTTITGSQVAIGTSAVMIQSALSTRQRFTLRNRGSATVYLGGPGVTTANGFALDPGETITIDGTTCAIWAISSAANTPVHTLTEA